MREQLHQIPDVTSVEHTTRLGRMFDSLSLPTYRLFWGAMMTQQGAMNMQMVARAWLIYELTNAYTMLGVMALANAMPMLFLSLFGGVLADRVQKKRVLVFGQGASSLVAAAIAIAIIADIISLDKGTGAGFLIGASIVQGIVMGLMMPSRQAIIPEIVGVSRLTNAIALNAAGMNINRLLAPGLSGLLIALLGIQTVYITMTILYVVGLLMVFRLPLTGTIALGRPNALADLREGLEYIRQNSVVMGLLILTLVGVIFSMPYMHLMPAFAKDVLIVQTGSYQWIPALPLIGPLLNDVPDLLMESSFRLGALLSVSGVGALIGSLWIAAMQDKNRGSLYIWSIVFLGLSLSFFAFTSSFAFAFLLMIGVGLGQSVRMALSMTLVQAYVDDEHRGRVMSIYMMEFGLSSFTTFAVASLANFIGVQWALGICAVLLIPLGLFYLVFNRTLRRLQ